MAEQADLLGRDTWSLAVLSIDPYPKRLRNTKLSWSKLYPPGLTVPEEAVSSNPILESSRIMHIGDCYEGGRCW